jgi:hypothetical protein
VTSSHSGATRPIFSRTSGSYTTLLDATRAYAHALTTAAHPDSDESRVESRVGFQMARQLLFDWSTGMVRLDVTLDESVLHRRVGGPTVMAEQLRHLRRVAAEPDVTVRVVPMQANPLAACGPFAIMECRPHTRRDGVTPVVCVGGLDGCCSSAPRPTSPATVARSRLGLPPRSTRTTAPAGSRSNPSTPRLLIHAVVPHATRRRGVRLSWAGYCAFQTLARSRRFPSRPRVTPYSTCPPDPGRPGRDDAVFVAPASPSSTYPRSGARAPSASVSW